MQMAEKYRMDKVVLSDEAKQMLMRYKWPGNIRQLKSITEQLSVLSTERLITPEILARFIPQNQETTQLATIHNEGDHTFENEREILYKILFELHRGRTGNRTSVGTTSHITTGSHPAHPAHQLHDGGCRCRGIY